VQVVQAISINSIQMFLEIKEQNEENSTSKLLYNSTELNLPSWKYYSQ